MQRINHLIKNRRAKVFNFPRAKKCLKVFNSPVIALTGCSLK